MNARRTLLVAAALAAFPVSAAVERIRADQLPSAVRQTLDANRAQDPVKEIVRRDDGGRVVYDIVIEKNNALNPRLRIAEDGTLIREPITPAVTGAGDVPVVPSEYGDPSVLAFPRLQLADLPAVVQETARAQAKGREIADIDEEKWNGRTVYEIEFKERGLNSRVYVAADGSLVGDEPGRSLKSLFKGTQLEDTPAAVQETIRRVAGDREILDIDKIGAGGRASYRVELRNGSGAHILRIGADGQVIYDSRAPEKRSRG